MDNSLLLWVEVKNLGLQLIAVDSNGHVLSKSQFYERESVPSYCYCRSRIMVSLKNSIAMLDAQTLDCQNTWTDKQVRKPRRVCSTKNRAAVYDWWNDSISVFKWEDDMLSHHMIFHVEFKGCIGVQLLPDDTLVGMNDNGQWSAWSDYGTPVHTALQHPTLVSGMKVHPSLLQDPKTGECYVQEEGIMHDRTTECKIIYNMGILMGKQVTGRECDSDLDSNDSVPQSAPPSKTYDDVDTAIIDTNDYDYESLDDLHTDFKVSAPDASDDYDSVDDMHTDNVYIDTCSEVSAQDPRETKDVEKSSTPPKPPPRTIGRKLTRTLKKPLILPPYPASSEEYSNIKLLSSDTNEEIVSIKNALTKEDAAVGTSSPPLDIRVSTLITRHVSAPCGSNYTKESTNDLESSSIYHVDDSDVFLEGRPLPPIPDSTITELSRTENADQTEEEVYNDVIYDDIFNWMEADKIKSFTVFENEHTFDAVCSDSENLICAATVVKYKRTELDIKLLEVINIEDKCWKKRHLILNHTLDLEKAPNKAKVVAIAGDKLLLCVDLDGITSTYISAHSSSGRVVLKSQNFSVGVSSYNKQKEQLLVPDWRSSCITQLDSQTFKELNKWTDERVKYPWEVCSNSNRAAVNDNGMSISVFKWECEHLSNDIIFAANVTHERIPRPDSMRIQLLADSTLVAIKDNRQWSAWKEDGTVLHTNLEHPTLFSEMQVNPLHVIQDSNSNCCFVQELGKVQRRLVRQINCLVIYDVNIALSRLNSGSRLFISHSKLKENMRKIFKK